MIVARCARFRGIVHSGIISPRRSMCAASSVLLPCATRNEDIWADVVQRYEEAKVKHATSITETTAEIMEDAGVHFVLRIAAMLRDKPKAPPADGTPRTYRNPFLPPDPDLLVRHLSPTHSLLLNKFNLVAYHCLVVTREYESQENPLTEEDMGATWGVMQAMPGGGLAYFNRGPVSGASQQHKHLQVVPLPLAPGGKALEDDPPFFSLVMQSLAGVTPGEAVPLCGVPFVATAVALDPSSENGASLAASVARALAAAERAVKAPIESYNMVMTQRYAMVVPRSCEADGSVGCNAMGFAGSFFVRSSEELNRVRERGPMAVLETVGIRQREPKGPK
jgi:sulfate adenylyltransferase (ADP) / ATP adenylyltransferase